MDEVTRKLSDLTVELVNKSENEKDDTVLAQNLREFTAKARALIYKQPDEPTKQIIMDHGIDFIDTADALHLIYPNGRGTSIIKCILKHGRALVDSRDSIPVGTLIDDSYMVLTSDPVWSTKDKKYQLCTIEEQ